MKEQIKTWLREFNHPREWLADQLDVSKKTVDNWLSSPQEIPSGKLKLIEHLMAEDAADEVKRQQMLSPTNQVFSLEVDVPTFRAYNKAALAAGMTIEDWSIAMLNEAAAEEANNKKTGRKVHDFPQAPTSMVAEDSAKYGV